MARLFGGLGIGTLLNFGIYALAIAVTRGVYYIPSGPANEFYLVGIIAALLNTFVAPILMIVKIPKLIFVQLILLVSMNGMLLQHMSNRPGSGLRIDTLGWLVGASIIMGMMALLIGAINRAG